MIPLMLQFFPPISFPNFRPKKRRFCVQDFGFCKNKLFEYSFIHQIFMGKQFKLAADNKNAYINI